MDVSLSELINNLLHVYRSGISDWGNLHPVVVHFPIVLLCAAPLFIIAACVFQRSQKTLQIVSISVLLLGTAGIFLAVSTGDSAAEPLTPQSPAMVATLNSHVALGEQARLNFSVLTVVYLLYVLFHSKLTQKLGRKTSLMAVYLFLIIFGVNLVILFNVAHYGGKLVHQHGITSSLFLEPSEADKP